MTKSSRWGKWDTVYVTRKRWERTFKIGKCGEQGGNEGQDDRGDGGGRGLRSGESRKRIFWHFDENPDERYVCVELAADDVCQRVPYVSRFLCPSPDFLRERSRAHWMGKWSIFRKPRGFLVISTPRKCENVAKSDMRSSAKLKSSTRVRQDSWTLECWTLTFWCVISSYFFIDI